MEETFHPNGQLGSRRYVVNGKFHREDAPAVRFWNANGTLNSAYYYIDDKLHRADGPAIKYWDNNGIIWKEYYYIDGQELTKEEFLSQLHPTKSANKT